MSGAFFVRFQLLRTLKTFPNRNIFITESLPYLLVYTSMHANILLQKICDVTREMYFEKLPPVKIVVQDDPKFEGSCVGFWINSEKTIYLKPQHVIGVPFPEIQDTIKHELVHAWCSHIGKGKQPYGGHGATFFYWAIQSGVEIDFSCIFSKQPESRKAYEEALVCKRKIDEALEIARRILRR